MDTLVALVGLASCTAGLESSLLSLVCCQKWNCGIAISYAFAFLFGPALVRQYTRFVLLGSVRSTHHDTQCRLWCHICQRLCGSHYQCKQ